MEPTHTLLVVEDDPAIRRLICKTVQHEGWQAQTAETIKRALIEVKAKPPACVLLDLGLPDCDGNEFIRQVRTWSDLPIIVLTARDNEASKVAALDAGANDYVTKPFSIAELLARIRVQLRQRQPTATDSVYTFGAVSVDSARHSVRFQGEDAHLTPTEYRLLLELLRHEGKICTHRQLLLAVWGPNCVETPHYLRVYMAKLRQKLEIQPEAPQHFVTESGLGYRFIK